MNYIVLDLEWNQCPLGKKFENEKLPFEIIEIGAVKLNDKLKEVGRFHKVIKPKVYKDIHFKTRQVINLTMKDLRQGVPFTIAAREFLKWCGKEYIFCIWGSLDITELRRNLNYYDMDKLVDGPVKYYDLQKLFSILYEDGKERSNLKAAVEFLKLPERIEYHSAINDAIYTAKVMAAMDFYKVSGYYSVDCYRIPKNKESEINITFDSYSKYISKGYTNREEMMKEKDTVSTVCYKCGKRCRKKIRWFAGNNKTYYSLANCNEHGFLKGKIRVKQNDAGLYYIIKTLKLVDEDGAMTVREKQAIMRRRRREKRYKAHLEN